MKTILVPLDGSELAEAAIPYAAALARADGGRLLLVRAAYLLAPLGGDAERVRAEALAVARDELEPVVQGLRDDGLAVGSRVAWGAPDEVIVGAAAVASADLIALSSHGRGGVSRALMGSVADAVLRRAPAPVLLVTPRVAADWPHGRAARVLVALDGSAFAEEALGPAVEVAGALGADLHLFRVVVPPPPPYAPPPGVPYYRAEEYFEPEKELDEARAYLCRLAERRLPDGPVVTVGAAMGDPTAAIADLVRDGRFDLVVLATHGRGGVSRLLMGSVATALVARSTAPLLAVRPEALRRGDATAAPPESVVSPDPAARPGP